MGKARIHFWQGNGSSAATAPDVKLHQMDLIECADQTFIKRNTYYKSIWNFHKNVTLKEHQCYHLIRKRLTEKLWQRKAEENNENASGKG